MQTSKSIEFPCNRCIDTGRCKLDGLYELCSALHAYRIKMRRRRLGL